MPLANRLGGLNGLLRCLLLHHPTYGSLAGSSLFIKFTAEKLHEY